MDEEKPETTIKLLDILKAISTIAMVIGFVLILLLLIRVMAGWA